MKVRWTRSSVRLRITPSELTGLERGEVIRETLALPNGAWSVAIIQDAATGLDLHGGDLRFTLSSADMARLSDPEAEGVYFQRNDTASVEQDESRLRYYIEKDFPCAHPRAGEAEEPTTETFAPLSDSPSLLT